MRRIVRRVNGKLGTNLTLHDAGHTAAVRMAGDERLTLAEVQTILRTLTSTRPGGTSPLQVEDMHGKLRSTTPSLVPAHIPRRA
jgi:hypothetical protein